MLPIKQTGQNSSIFSSLMFRIIGNKKPVGASNQNHSWITKSVTLLSITYATIISSDCLSSPEPTCFLGEVKLLPLATGQGLQATHSLDPSFQPVWQFSSKTNLKTWFLKCNNIMHVFNWYRMYMITILLYWYDKLSPAKFYQLHM